MELTHALPISHENSNWLQTGHFGEILDAKKHHRSFFCKNEQHLGFIPNQILFANTINESNFLLKAHEAADFSGFQRKESAKLIAAIKELYCNTAEHSNDITSAYTAFFANRNTFEFVVADSGIGVLESLRTNSQFEKLQDHGSALEAALTEGVSRHDNEVGRGYGFRPIFVGLANLSENLRFRSGDHAREITRNSNGSILAATKQKSNLYGFFSSVISQAGRKLQQGQ